MLTDFWRVFAGDQNQCRVISGGSRLKHRVIVGSEGRFFTMFSGIGSSLFLIFLSR